MPKRKVIKIDEAKCNGCGQCIPDCPEGAIQIIDKKARIVSDLFCDGLGACLGHCPQQAISIEERGAASYDEAKVMANIIKQGKNVIKAHLTHLREHKQEEYLKQALDFLKENNIEAGLGKSHTQDHVFSGCPGSKMMAFENKGQGQAEKKLTKPNSFLSQWPVQIMLVPENAPYFDNADLLIAADCVPFAYADFHQDLLKGHILLVGCPKLDNLEVYRQKISRILAANRIKSVTYAHMEVPCCFGLLPIIQQAISDSGKDIPFKETITSIRGQKLK